MQGVSVILHWKELGCFDWVGVLREERTKLVGGTEKEAGGDLGKLEWRILLKELAISMLG